MKIKKIVAVILSAIMLCAVFAGCSDSGKTETIQGKWNQQATDHQALFTFTGDNLRITALGYDIHAECKFEGDNAITINYESVKYENVSTGQKIDIEPIGIYPEFDEASGLPTGELIPLDEPFVGTYDIDSVGENVRLTLRGVDNEGNDVKWIFYRTY